MIEAKTIDVHAHFLPPIYREALRDAGLKSLDGGFPVPDWTPERAIEVMDEVGITGALLSVSSPHVNFVDQATAVTLCRAINDYAAEIRRLRSDRFGAYAILPLPDAAASLAEMERALDQLNLDGVALPTHAQGLYLGDPQFAPLLEALNERSATVFIHPTSPCCFEAFGLELPAPMMEYPFETTRTAASLLYSGALTRNSRINFILPHAGGTLPMLAPRVAAIGSMPILGRGRQSVPMQQAMEAFAGFFYDTALSVAPQQIAALRALAPTSQLLYGTDFPFADADRVRNAESAFRALSFTPEERAMVRSGNANRLFPEFAVRCRSSGHSHKPPEAD